jgi:acid phosphatase type 7
VKKRNTIVGFTLLAVMALVGGIGAVPIQAATCPSATSTATSGDAPVTGTIRACASVAATNYRVTVLAKQGTATTTIFDVKPVALDSTEKVVGTWTLATSGTYTIITKLLRSGALVTKSTITVTVGGTTPPPPSNYDIAAAGDIATSANGDTKTSNLVLALNPQQVYTLGDNVYPSGTATPAPYIEKYGPTWGRFLAKTFPTVGNHDYYPKLTGGGYGGPGGYQTYFADSAGGGDLNYSHTFDEWLVVHLDSEGPTATALAHLEAQLASTSTSCQIVISHHPYISSGEHGNDAKQQPIWDASVAGNVEIVLNGHEHSYERFAPVSGTTQFVVGMGGVETKPFGATQPGSVRRITGNPNRGVLGIDISPTGWTADFIAAAGPTVLDSASGACEA